MMVIDASVWVSAVVPGETGHAESRQLLSIIQNSRLTHDIFVPVLLRVEIAAAIAKNKNDPRLAESYSGSIDLLYSLNWVDVGEKISQLARRIAIDQRLRAYDATYAAIALEYECDLVSLDKDHPTRLVSTVSTFSPLQMIARLNAT